MALLVRAELLLEAVGAEPVGAELVGAQTAQPASTAIALPVSGQPVLYYPGDSATADDKLEFRPVAYVDPAAVDPAATSSATSSSIALPTDSVAAPAIATPASPDAENRSAAQPEIQPVPAAVRSPARASAQRKTGPISQYVMEFNRDPAVGNRLRLQGVYPETRLNFTRPQNWEMDGAKVVLRYQHSPTLLPDKSQLMLRVNDTSVGSVPLAQKNSQIAEAVFTIPPNLIQDYNEVSMLAQQQNAETCANPADPTLWTEILPDSKIVMDYRPQPIRLDFSSFPLPFLDPLSLEPNRLSYLRPQTYSNDWLTATARFQTSAARLLDYRPLESQLIQATTQLKRDDRLIVIGTPAQQPILSQIALTFPVKNGQLVDRKGNAVPDNVGLLLLTTLKPQGTPVLVATGNSDAAVRQAVQSLVQSRDRQIGAGSWVIVDQVADSPAQDARSWPGYLPTESEFQLSDLTLANRQPFQEVTVRGTGAPSIEIPFRALPDDRFLRGSSMTLDYSYSPQVNPRNSAIEVKLDGVAIGSKRLGSSGGSHESFRLNLPETLVKPDSRLSVNFILNSEEPNICGIEADRQLWGTLHPDSSFKLIRDRMVTLPDLKLLKAGFPLASPQDLSTTAIVLPAEPAEAEVETLLALGDRLGRVSQAESVKYEVYTGEVPASARGQNIVGIGPQARFPIAEALQDQGFNLTDSFIRFWGGSKVHALPEHEAVLKQTHSPWNSERTLVALTAQTEAGLRELQALLTQDSLFSQLHGDTVLINRKTPNPSRYDDSGYSLEFLQEAPPRRIHHGSLFTQITLFLQDHWFLMLVGILLLAILLYGLSQLFLNRVADSGDA